MDIFILLDALLKMAGVSPDNKNFIITWVKENVVTSNTVCHISRKVNFPSHFTITIDAMSEIATGNRLEAIKEIRSSNPGMGLGEAMVIGDYLIHMHRNFQK